MKKIFPFLLLTIFLSCKKDNPVTTDNNILPKIFFIDLNSAISSPVPVTQRVAEDLPAGSQYYEDLRNLLYSGENYAYYVSSLITGIRKHGIEKPTSFTVTGDDDNNQKFIEVKENVVAENTTWQYGMTVRDVPSGATGLQLFWNNNPVKGFAIVNEYAINTKLDSKYKDRMLRVDYSELPGTYDASMTLTATGLTGEIRNMKTMKFTTTRYGTILDIFGNTSHPDLKITSSSAVTGRQYAFTAKANRSTNLGVVYLGLPPLNLEDRNSILTDYSLQKVLDEEYTAANIADTSKAKLLATAGMPAFLTQNGFASVGKVPEADTTGFKVINVDFSGMKPYAPREVTETTISFK